MNDEKGPNPGALRGSRRDGASSLDAIHEVERLASAPGPGRPDDWRDDLLAARPVLRSDRENRVCVIVHPLEATSEARRGPTLARVVAQAEATQADVRFCSWFKLIRTPGQALIALDSVSDA